MDPTLLTSNRMTARLLISELIKDGSLDTEITGQVCTVFDGGAYAVTVKMLS
jgi:hypothetical protein